MARTRTADLRVRGTLSYDGVAIPLEGRSIGLHTRYGALGLRLVDKPACVAETALITEAFAALDVEPNLLNSISNLVASIHRIEAQGPGFDSSHSDPELPFSIFVSVPIGEAMAPLRLAESILHEAMHLQLSLIESRCSLVRRTTGKGYSPWQKAQRPISGLLHGLYVFVVIDSWFGMCLAGTMDDSEREFAERRRRDIQSEVAEVEWMRDSDDLSELGNAFTRRLLDAIPVSRDNRYSSS